MTALPSTEDLARLAKAITPGPWRRNLENTVCNQIDGEHHAICTDQFCYAPEEQQDANAEAIALVPALIREVLDRREAEAGMRSLLRAGCDLLADECDNIKASITMPDGSLSANPLDARRQPFGQPARCVGCQEGCGDGGMDREREGHALPRHPHHRGMTP